RLTSSRDKADNAAISEMKLDQGFSVYEIERQLATASMTLVEQRDPHATYNKMGRLEFLARYPNINWEHYFTAMKFPHFDSLIVAQPAFLDVVNKMIVSVYRDNWRAYMKSHFVSNAAP